MLFHLLNLNIFSAFSFNFPFYLFASTPFFSVTLLLICTCLTVPFLLVGLSWFTVVNLYVCYLRLKSSNCDFLYVTIVSLNIFSVNTRLKRIEDG